ncbi:2-hydroxychromene-2-carboxylate isomerase [Rhodoferax saidenbachensis]|uniref:2-hydroxychromene-2-carboxylate isomerase n=1 Tax=Rhodoferax saidenbachensis TaxID=1484693 RepID=A0A1P8KFP0_9BURK|nr:2-hydroxychromene-2-carboxylate isomerase [Rhodoferax saidenbachensis]APW44860.1 disulfide bond formation protein DsbA [Rhodoferax saidenbachensis]
MAKTAEFFLDVGSPATYLAWTQLPALCAQTGATLVYKPMLLGGVFQATGNASPATVPAKGSYMTDDLGRFAKRYGVPFVMNPHFPINTLQLMRGVIGIQLREPARLDAFLKSVFEALWVKAANLNDPATVAATLAAAGFDPAQVFALVNDPEIKAALKTNTEEAVSRGVFGAPTVFVNGTMFFGQDRLDFVREALA